MGILLLYLLEFVVQHDLYLREVLYAEVLGHEGDVVGVVAVVSLEERLSHVLLWGVFHLLFLWVVGVVGLYADGLARAEPEIPAPAA